MTKYLNELQEVDRDVFINMDKASHITITFIEDVLYELDRDWTHDPIERGELGSINYQINSLLTIWNPSLEYDIEILKRLDEIIGRWRDNVQFVNMALGVPNT